MTTIAQSKYLQQPITTRSIPTACGEDRPNQIGALMTRAEIERNEWLDK